MRDSSTSVRKNAFYLNRGECFVFALNALCLAMLEKYGNPLKSHSLYLKMGLKIAVRNKLVADLSSISSSSFSSNSGSIASNTFSYNSGQLGEGDQYGEANDN